MAIELAATGNPQADRIAAWALGILELSLDDPAAAHEHLGPLVASRRAAGVAEPGDMRFVTDEVEALVGIGRLDEAEALLGWYEGLAEASGRIGALAACARCRGLLLVGRGDVDAALDALARSVELYRGVTEPLGLARTLLVLGAIERRRLHKRVARETLGAGASPVRRSSVRGCGLEPHGPSSPGSAAGWLPPTPSRRPRSASPPWSPRGEPIARSARSSSCPSGPSRGISRGSTPSSACGPGRSSPTDMTGDVDPRSIVRGRSGQVRGEPAYPGGRRHSYGRGTPHIERPVPAGRNAPMSAGQIVSVDRRLRVPVAAFVLATTFLIGAVAGATIPSLVSRTDHAGLRAAPRSGRDRRDPRRHELGRLRGPARGCGRDHPWRHELGRLRRPAPD